jgi:cobalt-zinc-cadmium efflux system protein
MSHSRDKSHARHHAHAALHSIRTAFFLNLLFTIIEIAGAILTNSIAILADAIHDLGDTATLGISWSLERFSHKGRDEKYTYGYRRFSLLGALVSGLVLLGGSVAVMAQAIPRLLHPQPAHAKGMIALAVLGVVVNGLAVLRLRGRESMNARMMMLHLLEDALGWLAVLIAGAVLVVKPWYVLDPLLSLAITCYVLYNALRNLGRTLPIFMQAAPREAETGALEARLAGVSGVKSVHHSHAWSMDGERHALTAHVVIDKDADGGQSMRIKTECKRLLAALGFTHVTIEIEHEGEACGASR